MNKAHEINPKRKRLIARSAVAGFLALTTALTIVLVSPAAGGAAPSTFVTYSLSGTATVSSSGFCTTENPCSSTATGTATCTNNCTGKPAGGSFNINITTIKSYPPSPCRVKSLSGSLSMTWSDATISTASVSGRFHDSKPTLQLSGTLDPGSVDWPPAPVDVLLNNYPPSPCTATSQAVTGALTISTP